ncbi:MAG TPA: DoxX family protein, partial [Flavobacteriales bacterium]|nr:DoxX family protein [Flavobacteriales bacterium]
SEKDFYTKHFAKSILNGSVFLLMPVITLMELAAGLFSAAGFFQVLFSGNTSLGTLGMLLACAALTMLFFGQRVAKDYKGAAVLVPYFLLCAAGLAVFILW